MIMTIYEKHKKNILIFFDTNIFVFIQSYKNAKMVKSAENKITCKTT